MSDELNPAARLDLSLIDMKFGADLVREAWVVAADGLVTVMRRCTDEELYDIHALASQALEESLNVLKPLIEEADGEA
jgi:hypothetical protein